MEPKPKQTFWPTQEILTSISHHMQKSISWQGQIPNVNYKIKLSEENRKGIIMTSGFAKIMDTISTDLK